MGNLFLLNNDNYISVGKQIIMEKGIESKHAEILMLSLLDADEKGIYTHGFYRLPTYIKQIDRGNINHSPNIKNIKDSKNIKIIDADNGLGSVVSFTAISEAVTMSSERGVGVVGVRNSNHFGTASYFAEMAAKQNQIGIVMTNASPAIAPTGSNKPILGNNPWSISVPTNLGYPITLDIANSVAARGKIRLKALSGESIPLGWALNSKGEPTTDANEALEGIILPIGDYKGYGITLMIDILSGVLTGAAFGDQVPGVEEDGKRNNGHLFISLDVESFMDINEFKSRIDQLTEIVKTAPKINKETRILLPGEIEWNTKLNQRLNTVKLPERIFNLMSSLCEEYNLQLPEHELVQE
jgi:LDH2 family malate/lactate/ureidoglycolate dehydrogenase